MTEWKDLRGFVWFDETLVSELISRTRIVVVGMLASPHLARWLAAGRDCNAEVLLFPSVPYRSVHPAIADLIDANGPLTVTVHPGLMIGPPVHSALQRFVPRTARARMLARAVEDFQPDLVHAVELQHAGYLTVRALKKVAGKRRPPLSVVNWGSDVFWFQRKPWHRRQIRNVLSEADYYSCECKRDVDLAILHGFSGVQLIPGPNFGVALPPSLTQPPLDLRQTIALKGYSSFVGRAHHLLFAWALINPKLDGARLEIYSASLLVRLLSKLIELRNRSLAVITYPHGTLSSNDMWELLARSRVYVGFSASDGLPASLHEALLSGAIPMQTNSACTDDLKKEGFHIIDLNSGRPFKAVKLIADAFSQPSGHQEKVRRNTEIGTEFLRPESVAQRSESSLAALIRRIQPHRRA